MAFIQQIVPWVTSKERAALDRYLRTGGWLTEFTETQELERRLAKFLGVRYVSLTNNGTVALFLALKAVGVGQGDEVIVPNLTMVATPNAVRLAGATPVLADVDEGSLCIDSTKLKKTKKTKALIHVSLNGRAGNIEAVRRWCTKNKVHFIEDACQAFASKHRGKFLGTFGEIGCFSMSPHKIITTGQGGFVATNRRDLYERVERLKDFGRLAGGADFHDALGFNFKFTDVQAVLGLAQLGNISERVRRKRKLYKRYRDLLADVGAVRFHETNLRETTPWFVDIYVPARRRAALAARLKRAGVGSRPLYPAVSTQPIYRRRSRTKLLVSERVAREGLWLPSSVTLTKSEVQLVCRTIREFFNA